jgi:hypothetical protein
MKFYSGLTLLLMALQSWGAYPNGPSSEGNVSAASLLAWVAAHKTSTYLKVQNGFANRDGDPLTVSLYQYGNSASGAVYFESNMDVDCDGSNSGACNGFDPSHQNTLSCGCSVNEGGPVDADVTPFYVLPIGSPFNSSGRGIDMGQVAACIYNNGSSTGIAYAVFLDEDGVSTEIGEGSAALSRFLGINPDPGYGGSESGNTYIVFPGSRISDYANHSHAVSVGQAAAKALVGSRVSEPVANFHGTSAINYQISKRIISIKSSGSHSISVFSLNGENVMALKGEGAKTYNMSALKSGTYIVKINLEGGLFTDKIMIY